MCQLHALSLTCCFLVCFAGGIFIKSCGSRCPLVISNPLEAANNRAAGEGAGGTIFFAGDTEGVMSEDSLQSLASSIQGTANDAVNGSYGMLLATEPLRLGELNIIKVLAVNNSGGNGTETGALVATAAKEPWLRDLPLAVAMGDFFDLKVGVRVGWVQNAADATLSHLKPQE